MLHSFNYSTWKFEELHSKFKTNQGYIVKPCFKKRGGKGKNKYLLMFKNISHTSFS